MISVQIEDFDVGHEYAALRKVAGDAGAIVTFSGLVRELYAADSLDNTRSLTLEHYPGMTEKCLADIAVQAGQRWQLLGTRIIHRVGLLQAGDQIVFVGTASAHRQHAFEAAEYMMDYLKSNAPFWKKQCTATGSHWVDSRDTDQAAIARWQQTKS